MSCIHWGCTRRWRLQGGDATLSRGETCLLYPEGFQHWQIKGWSEIPKHRQLEPSSLVSLVQWQSLKELRQLLLTTMALTAVSLDLPMNYFDDYFTLEKQQQANDVCGVHPGWVRNRTLFTLEKAAWEPWTWTSWIFFCFSWFLVVVFSTSRWRLPEWNDLALGLLPSLRERGRATSGTIALWRAHRLYRWVKHVKQVFWWGPLLGILEYQYGMGFSCFVGFLTYLIHPKINVVVFDCTMTSQCCFDALQVLRFFGKTTISLAVSLETYEHLSRHG